MTFQIRRSLQIVFSPAIPLSYLYYILFNRSYQHFLKTIRAKKTKLPENLYHYTSLIKYRMILATGKLVLAPSNLKYDNATFHKEPMFFNGHEIGVKAVDKYENYHPVVWLTANDHAGAKNTGLSNDKIMCRITIRTNGKIWRYLPWRTFCDKYNADRSVASTLKQTANDYLNWYVCESEIPVADFAKVEFLAEDGTYKDEKDIPGFALTDIAPELFE